MADMINARRGNTVRLIGAIALPILVLAGCGSDSASSPEGPTATLTLANGDTYTVTLAPGVTEPIDIFGNDGGAPVGIWGESSPGGSEVLQITSKVGEPFGVEVPQSASTGAAWQPTGGTAPGTVVELVQDFVLAEDKGPGSPGTHYFVYRSTAAGTGTLEFSLFPPGSQQPSATLNAEVTVGP